MDLRGDRATGVTAPGAGVAAASTLVPPGLVPASAGDADAPASPAAPAAPPAVAGAVAMAGGAGGALAPAPATAPVDVSTPPLAGGLGENEGRRGGGGGGDRDDRAPAGGATGPAAAAAAAAAAAGEALLEALVGAGAGARIAVGDMTGARVTREARRLGLGEDIPGGSNRESTARRRSASMPGSTAPRALGSRRS